MTVKQGKLFPGPEIGKWSTFEFLAETGAHATVAVDAWENV